MKSVILSAVAAVLMVALPVSAAEQQRPAAQQGSMQAANMTPEECKRKMADCKDQACKDNLVSQGCSADQQKM